MLLYLLFLIYIGFIVWLIRLKKSGLNYQLKIIFGLIVSVFIYFGLESRAREEAAIYFFGAPIYQGVCDSNSSFLGDIVCMLTLVFGF